MRCAQRSRMRLLALSLLAVTSCAATTGATPEQHDPVVLVHGIFGSEHDFDTLKDKLVARGFDRERLFARVRKDTTESLRDQARRLKGHVEEALLQTGAERVDLVAHSQGALVARLYLAELGGHMKVRNVVLLCGANHGSGRACGAAALGPGIAQMCPSHADEDRALDGIQFALNGKPGENDVDETPFGLEDGGPLVWSAIALKQDLVIEPWQSSCLNQSSPMDCSDPVNTVVDWPGSDHGNMLREDRTADLVAEQLRR